MSRDYPIEVAVTFSNFSTESVIHGYHVNETWTSHLATVNMNKVISMIHLAVTRLKSSTVSGHLP